MRSNPLGVIGFLFLKFVIYRLVGLYVGDLLNYARNVSSQITSFAIPASNTAWSWAFLASDV